MATVRHQLTDVVAAAVTTSVRVWYAPVDENLLDVTRRDHVGDGGAVLGEELQCPNLNTLVHGGGKVVVGSIANGESSERTVGAASSR